MKGKRTITYTWHHLPTGKNGTTTRKIVGDENYVSAHELVNGWNRFSDWKYVLVGETWS